METRRNTVLAISSLCLFAVISICLILSDSWRSNRAEYHTVAANGFAAPKQNIWAELTVQEADDVYDYLFEELAHLNLTKHPRSGLENFIFTLETLQPNKTDAISYLHDDTRVPERWAKAAVSQNFDNEPYMVYYAVGPLPITSETEVEPLSYVFNSGTNYIQNPVQDFFAIMDYGISVAENISDITQRLLGASANRNNPDDPDGLQCWPRGSRIETGGLSLWFQMFRSGMQSGARTLLPQGIYVRIDTTSSDTADWSASEYYYNGILYDNVDDFRSAVTGPDFVSTPANFDGSWTDTEDFESAPPGRELPPPVSVQPYGPRYKLDKQTQYISWFGFEFYVTTAQATAVSLFDIRFRGERVMYELGLQEALSHYAGDDPMQGGLEFLDSFFGMGKSMFELVPGYDCPAYADYLDSEWHQTHKTQKMPNSICIFEYTSDHLLSRHTSQNAVTASRNTYLILRWVSTVGNYDYTFEYIFYLDGTFEVKVRASGFIFGAFYTANNTKSEDEYGHRIHDALASSMHDHVINFKADLDVAGSANDAVRLAVEPVTKSFLWDRPQVKERNTMHLVEYAVEEEVGLDWPKNSGEFYTVYSADQRNAWNERKGYRITSGTGVGSTPHLTIQNSTTLGDSARWSEHDIWFVRQKDTEPRSADPLNWFAPKDPLIDFNKIADHESLKRDEEYDGDLVVYFNLGSHHVPHSGDIPNTLMHTSASSVMFIPHNFHDRDPSRASVQGVRLQLKGNNSGGFAGQEGSDALRMRMDRRADKKKGPYAKYFGTPYDQSVKLPLEAFEPDLKEEYESKENGVSNLSFNGSAAGVWFRDDRSR